MNKYLAELVGTFVLVFAWGTQQPLSLITAKEAERALESEQAERRH